MGVDPKHHHHANAGQIHAKQDNGGSHDGQSADSGGQSFVPTPADQATQIATSLQAAPTQQSSPGLSAPPKFDLGDRAIGTPYQEKFQLFNTEPVDAYVRVRYEGSPDIKLISSPERVRPPSEGVDTEAAIGLAFSPTTKGHARGTIVVQAKWRNASHAPLELHIPVEAAAHEVGGKPLAEEEAEQREREQKERSEAQGRAEMDQAKKADEARMRDPKFAHRPVTEAEHRLDDYRQSAQTALTALFDKRRVGVETAEGEAVKYVKQAPAYHESLLETLAFAGLEIAGGAIVGYLGTALKHRLAAATKVAEHTLPDGSRAAAADYSPSEAAVAFITDSFKDIGKRAVKAGTGAAKHDHGEAARSAPETDAPETRPPAAASSDPLLAFFDAEKLSLIDARSEKAEQVTMNARYALQPLVETHPEVALASMKAIADELLAQGNGGDKALPAREQAHASRSHWIQYVAQSSLGSITPEDAKAAHLRTRTSGASQTDAAPTTNIEAANAAPTSRGAPAARDGLVDVAFHADIAHPTAPATIKEVRINGISNTLAKHLAEKSLLELGIAVRAYAIPDGSNAVVGLSASRDEAGNVDYTDETGAPGMPGNWFARKAGEPAGGRDAALRGARQLLEREIMSRPIDKPIKTDSTD